jgi:LPS-assembly protein
MAALFRPHAHTIQTDTASIRCGLLIAALLGPGAPAAAQAQESGTETLQLRLSPQLRQPGRGDNATRSPVVVQAREIRGQPDLSTRATGDVELRNAGVVVRADSLTYEQSDDQATARGNVRVSREGNVYTGPELQLRLQRFEGYFLKPNYVFARSGAGGMAERIDFLDEQRMIATRADYSSCPRDGSGDPAWLLSTDSIKLDFAANEGVAENAVLRFYGVPILAAPVLSFPLTDERKSGWLPPGLNLDSKSGLQVSVPYYWNIAPQRDATLTPVVIAKRGFGLDTEFRYLEQRHQGEINLATLPNDRLTGTSRFAMHLTNEADMPFGVQARARWLRVSDDEYWKDFARGTRSITPRLLGSELTLNRSLDALNLYARVQQWQVLQDASSLIEAPYQRAPQLGTQWARRFDSGTQAGVEVEVNRFTNPTQGVTGTRATGVRAHSIGSLAWPWVTPGWTLTPRVQYNAATYALDGALDPTPNAKGEATDPRRRVSRLVPGMSLDSVWLLERDTAWFGQATRQTLEPRLLYVNTAFRRQSHLPKFDAAAKDFNFDSIFSENAFSGVDRVSDAHQLTAGLTTRILDAASGAETMRLGIVQRYLFRDQFVTPDEVPLSQRFSDVLLLGSTSLIPRWKLDASVQYNPDRNEAVRSIVGARYSPGPFRTVGATYRLARDLSEQVEFAWQWPLLGATPERSALKPRPDSSSSCKGSWYSVGRVNYSTRDSRVTDSLLGLEYDSGCWIGRIVAERLSTGRSEATTRLLLQLELVGLSRLGTNPLQVLKDNIPGYRLLREGRPQSDPLNLYE